MDDSGTGAALTGDIDTRILSALLFAKDITEAAEIADVSRTTVYKRLKDAEFCARLESERARMVETIRESISEAAAVAVAEALQALREVVRGEYAGGFLGAEYATPADRVKAAGEIMRAYGTINRLKEP